jgi:MFS family permease
MAHPSLARLTRFILPPQPIPEAYRLTFLHLFFDLAWIGVLSGTTVAFLSVYAARLGATNDQIGFLSAAPAIINLLFAIPSGNWMKRWRLGEVVFWSSALARIFYLLFAFLPLFLKPTSQIWMIIVITLIMTIPLTFLNVSFNALMIEAVPPQWRAFVVGGRNGVLSIISMIATLGSGELLSRVQFPLGYQIVFGIGFFGALLSSFHLFRLRHIGADPIRAASWRFNFREAFPRNRLQTADRKYLRVLFLLFGFHISQWLVIPLVPLFTVNILRLNDFQISVGNSSFNLVVFIGSFFLASITGKIGNHKSTAFSMIGLGIFPLLLSFAKGFDYFLFANLIGGISWSILGGSLFNYLADHVPDADRAASMSWYILASNGSILIGSLAGPFIAGKIGFPLALLIFAILRILSGIAVLRLG